SVPELRELARTLLAQVEEGQAQAHELCLRYQETRVGAPYLAALLEDRAVAERALADPDPERRQCAVYLLRSHWKAGDPFLPSLEELARRDENPDVRREAINALKRLRRGSRDPQLSRWLASVVRGGQETEEIREAAYKALAAVQGLYLH